MGRQSSTKDAGHLGVEPVERSPQRDGHGAERDGLPEAVRVLAVRAGRRHELELRKHAVEFVLVQMALDDVGDVRSAREQFDDLRPTVPARAAAPGVVHAEFGRGAEPQ